jgi:pimeloyl-ACP methyl ester carboxylesterase
VAKGLELAIAVLNGAVGDYLAKTANGLATEMAFVKDGMPMPLTRRELARAYPDATPRVAVLVHGLMCTESVWALPDGSDYGSLLARDHGYTPLYIRYNSGLAIPDSGAALARLLEALALAYPAPIEQIVPIGFSMGGLVVRSACHVAHLEGQHWLSLVRRAIYVGTPHLGAPLERVGRVLAKVLEAVDDPYTRLIADIANLRSDGVKDLGDGDVRHEDRARRRGGISIRDPRHPVPLLPAIRHFLVAGSISNAPLFATFFGDAMVPVPSGTDGTCIDEASFALPPDHVRILGGMGHVTLAHHPDVYEFIKNFCDEAS